MSGVIPRAELVQELGQIRDIGEAQPDDSSRFVGAEARVTAYGLVQGDNALAAGDILGALQSLRLVAECAIRLRWIAFEGEEVIGNDNRPLVDKITAETRCNALRKRDLLQLAAAYSAVTEISGGGDREALLSGITALAAGIEGPPAPRDIRTLALSTIARHLYVGHRLASSMVHPGASLGRAALMTPEAIDGMLDDAAFIAAGFAAPILRALART